MSEQNKTLVRRVVEEVYNQGNLAVADELSASDLVIHQTSQQIRGRGAKQYVAALRATFPDLHMTIEDQIAEGDRVVTRWTARGTHTGEFQGIPPTGKEVRVAGTNIDRIADSKVVECWSHVDELGMMQQLGVVPVT
ncbi:ester cyclase [Phyllobacterium sp. LjRoot231]|uniref:ester cyclase n=2 Tax=Phyllobacterium sp. LjRoot231 TaxID=3342289 RepID=UPI003ECEDC41